MNGSGASVVMSHPAPTSCIQVPTLETRFAIQIVRKTRIFSGVSADAEVCPASGAAADAVIGSRVCEA
jgi:hypothetical protein